MTLILEATAGPIAGRRIEVRAGTIMRLGRTPKSDYAIGEDSYLSSQHFSLECDGNQCRVRDLGSSNGTFVNGERITERVLQQGDSVVAGGCTFAVHIDTSSVAATAAPSSRVNTAPTVAYSSSGLRTQRDNPMVTGEVVLGWAGYTRPQSALLNALFRDQDDLYAVLDASRDSRIPAFLDASGEPFIALDTEGHVPAYIVYLRPQSRLLDVLVKDGWGRGWGFYCASRSKIEEICNHWRNFLVLRTGDGRSLTFRFWDPRVLRALAPLMPAQEASEFFGPVSRMIVEGDKAEIALELTISPRGARQQALVLI